MSFSCRVCGNSKNNVPVLVNESRTVLKIKFQYFSCGNCNSLFIGNIPENLSLYYDNYYSFQKFKTEFCIRDYIKNTIINFSLKSQLKLMKFFARYFLDKENDFKIKSLMLLQLKDNWKILDVGSGSGDFVYNLHEIGFKNAIGIDPFLNESIQYTNGAKIFKKELVNLHDKFDLITFHHSFEHLDHPEHHLRKVKELLSPRGVCLIRLPNIDCLSYKIFKENWVGIHAPYHTFLPSYKGMQMLLESLGLKIQSCVGEQLIDFFLMSKEFSMGIVDDDKHSIRSIVREKGSPRHTPWHSKKEISYWKSMKKLVEKHKLCDCVCYYITHL